MPSMSGILMSVITRSGVLAALLHQFAACACHGHHDVAEAGQDRLQVVPHVELIVGHGDPEVTTHELASLLSGQCQEDLGSPFRLLANPDVAAVSLDDSLDDCHAQPCPAGLGSIKGFKQPVLLLAVRPGPLSRISRRIAACPSSVVAELVIVISTPSSRDERRIVKDITEDLLKAERVRLTHQVAHAAVFPEPRLLVIALGLEMGPCSSPDLRQVTLPEQQIDRRSILADILVKPMQVVLSLLDPSNQPERIRTVAQLQ